MSDTNTASERGPQGDLVGDLSVTDQCQEPNQSRRLKIAIAEAIAAFEQSGRMGEAALVYARHGFPICPLTVNKLPIPKRDPDPTGQYPEGIPGTGGVYKATTDPIIITAWWRRHPKALIGLPTGSRTGIWAIDADTAIDHTQESVTAWQALLLQHEPLLTRQHLSSTGGLHVIFNWYPGQPIGCGAGTLPAGISVKGQGGYIVAPPSQRRGHAYTVDNDIDPIDAPPWLIDAILQGRTTDVDVDYGEVEQRQVEISELADMLRYIPNDTMWEGWTAIGLAIFAVAGKTAGFPLFLEFSARWTKGQHRPDYTQKRWKDFAGSPPNRTGINKLRKLAMQHGWIPQLEYTEPTYPSGGYSTVDTARNALQQVNADFLQRVAHYRGNRKNPLVVALPTQQAARVDVGVGKTQKIVKAIAEWFRTGNLGLLIYAVPRHNLGEKIDEQFTVEGIDARIFRGREADDPENPGSKMCLNLAAVKLALKLHEDVGVTCCKSGKNRCRYFDLCGYQRQIVKNDEQPQIWIVASDMLFHKHKALGDPTGVIIDESIWQKGLRSQEPIALASLHTSNPRTPWLRYRNALFAALDKQTNDGGVEYRHFAGMIDFRHAIHWEWRAMPRPNLKPGMSDDSLKQAVSEDDIAAITLGRSLIRVFYELDMIVGDQVEVSGRLTLARNKKTGERELRWHGVDYINRQFDKPVLLLDATLPSDDILRTYFRSIRTVADIEVAMPSSVRVRQVLNAPTSARKLDDTKNDRHLQNVRRYIIRRWFELGQQPTLVICQKNTEQWLADKLPDNIQLAHYNNITGLDHFKDVRLLLLIGRTVPRPLEVERQAAQLSGIQGISLGPRSWYPHVMRGIRLPDERAIAVDGDSHPDDMAESVRWQICEAEMIQAIGRARAVNRTTGTPLNIDILANVCLPITVDEVLPWIVPSAAIEMLAEGVALNSYDDVLKAWPQLFNETSARRAIAQFKADQSIRQIIDTTWRSARYQRRGKGMRPKLLIFDPSRVKNLDKWLDDRLKARICE